MNPQRRRRLGRTGAAVLCVAAYAVGQMTHLPWWGVGMVVAASLGVFGLFQAYLLWCVDTVNREFAQAMRERNAAVAERDAALGSRDRIWAEARVVAETSQAVVQQSQALMAQAQAVLESNARVATMHEKRGYLYGEQTIVEALVTEARRQGADVEYVSLGDLDGHPETDGPGL